jgi:hypothetical protein
MSRQEIFSPELTTVGTLVNLPFEPFRTKCLGFKLFFFEYVISDKNFTAGVVVMKPFEARVSPSTFVVETFIGGKSIISVSERSAEEDMRSCLDAEHPPRKVTTKRKKIKSFFILKTPNLLSSKRIANNLERKQVVSRKKISFCCFLLVNYKR